MTITISVEDKTWEKLMFLKVNKKLKTHNDVIDYLIKIEKEVKSK